MDIINSHRRDVTYTRHIHGFITLLLLAFLTVPLAQAGEACNLSIISDGGSTAVGTNAFACGFFNTASGRNSSAVGVGNTSGESSNAVGGFNNASGINSSAVGSGNIASGTGSSALGAFNDAGGTNSSAVGSGNNASGDFSSALGSFGQVLGTASEYSIAIGGGNSTATGAVIGTSAGSGAPGSDCDWS